MNNYALREFFLLIHFGQKRSQYQEKLEIFGIVEIDQKQEYESGIERYIEGCEGYFSLVFKYPPPRNFHDLWCFQV